MSALLPHLRSRLALANRWALKVLPGWSDDDHRSLLARHGAAPLDGRASSRTMSAEQLRSALEDYHARGLPRRAKPPPAIGMMVLLWGRLGQAGKLRNEGRAGLLAFCRSQTGRAIGSLDDLSAAERSGVIEALKAWQRRQ